jgi:serine/threonine protein kinase
LSEHDERSIILSPLVAKPPEGFARKKATPAAFIMLTVSLADDPTGLQIANWLRSFPPATIQDVDIEALVLKARRIEGFKNIETLFTGSILGEISNSAQVEIANRLSALSGAVSDAATVAAATVGGPIRTTTPSDSSYAKRAIDELETNVSAVCDAIEGSLLLDSNVKLEAAAEDEVAIAIGATQALNLRQYLLGMSTIPDQPEIPRSAVKFKPTTQPWAKKRFRYGFIEEKPVIMETFQYVVPREGSSEASQSTIEQLKKMVTQLSQPKRTSFHILPCVGYLQERHSARFSIVFQVENNFIIEDSPISLSDLFSSAKRVPLGARVHLASTISIALENLHRVGWLHKELKSDNVLFFKSSPQRNVTETADSSSMSDRIGGFGLPWLFGFEYSRAEEADTYLESDYSLENNVYRHPERWGKPAVKFERSHDVYALVCCCSKARLANNKHEGIMLLEVALWKPIRQFAELKKGKIDPWIVKEDLLGKVNKDVPHMAGQKFSDAIAACLQFKELTSHLDEFETHMVLKEKILGKLQKAVGNV